MNRLLILLFLISSKLLLAQADREITYGFFAGANYSSLSNLQDAIIPNGIYSGYNLDEEAKIGGTGGLLINWKYPYAKISLQTEVSYSKQNTDLNYDDIKGLQYKIHFGYNYLNIGAQLKYYPVEGFYIGAGPYVGFNLTPDNISYTSNSQELFADSGAYFESDATVEKVLKESFTGKNHFSVMFSTGYEFSSNISIGARYSLGLTDAVATEENGHRFSENKNICSSISLIIGYSFNFDDLANF